MRPGRASSAMGRAPNIKRCAVDVRSNPKQSCVRTVQSVAKCRALEQARRLVAWAAHLCPRGREQLEHCGLGAGRCLGVLKPLPHLSDLFACVTDATATSQQQVAQSSLSALVCGTHTLHSPAKCAGLYGGWHNVSISIGRQSSTPRWLDTSCAGSDRAAGSP